MTERERLIGLLNQNRGCVEEQRTEELADYLLKNGVVVLPCKKNDIVFLALDGCKEVLQGYVTKLSLNRNGELIIAICRRQGKYYTNGNFKQSSFGKTVFFTREEAEKALEKLR